MSASAPLLQTIDADETSFKELPSAASGKLSTQANAGKFTATNAMASNPGDAESGMAISHTSFLCIFVLVFLRHFWNI